MLEHDEPRGRPSEAAAGDAYAMAGDDAQRRPSPDQPEAAPPPERQPLEEIIRAAEREASQRFSLWGLLGLMTVAAVVLGIGAYLPKAVFAGVLGIATLLAMVVLSLLKLPAAILQVGWWMLLVIYLLAIASAIRGP